MDALIAKAASTADGKVRNQTYCQIATRVANDLPRALLYETLEVTAYTPISRISKSHRVQRISPSARRIGRSRNRVHIGTRRTRVPMFFALALPVDASYNC